MEKSVITKAGSVELAVEKALAELGVDRDKVEVEVLQKGGLFKHAEVRVTVRESDADIALAFVNETLALMGIASRGKVVDGAEGEIVIEIDGEDSGAAIGYRGEVLDAIQFLARTYLNQVKPSAGKLTVDCENYRNKRRDTLVALAGRLAEKAYRTRRKVSLEPMNPFERRIIHSALADSEIAETVSEGEEPSRYVVIIPKGVEIREDRPRRGDRRDARGGRRDDRRGRDERGGRDDRRNRSFKGDRDDRRRERTRTEEEEVPDGNVYTGYFTDDFVKQEQKPSGPPKFKSFGGKKKF